MSGGKQELRPGELAAKWLTKNNQVQHEWAYIYLHQRRFPFSSTPHNVSMYEWLKFELERQSDTVEMKFLLQKMKRAWSQKKLRSKSGGRKAYTYVLAESFGNKLGRLAKKCNLPACQMLENILEKHERVQNDLDLIEGLLEKERDLNEREENLEKREAEIRRKLADISNREIHREGKNIHVNNMKSVPAEERNLIRQLLEEFEEALLELGKLKESGSLIMVRNKPISSRAQQAIQNRLKKYSGLK